MNQTCANHRTFIFAGCVVVSIELVSHQSDDSLMAIMSFPVVWRDVSASYVCPYFYYEGMFLLALCPFSLVWRDVSASCMSFFSGMEGCFC